MADVKGHFDEEFSQVKEVLAENVKSGAELGACVCVNINGRNVVDIWSGYIDNDATKEWQEDTILNVWSCSKTVTNLAVLIAHDRGLLDVHEKVSKYWPEFAQNGKEGVLVKHILSHSTGVAGWRPGITMEEACDVPTATAKLAKQEPWWEPGTASGYHALNQGHLAGELIRRVTGKSLKQFIAEEIAGPLGADFQLGAVEKDWPRISTLIPPPPLTGEVGAADPNSVAMKALTQPNPDALFAFTPTWRGSEIGAANGHGNARALVRILSIISRGGEVDGVRLLSPKTIDTIFEEQTNGVDLVLGKPIRFGIGYGLPNETTPWLAPDGKICFWGGWVSNTKSELQRSYSEY
jgi:CubicO group peptidase (beta-lactamase class C family)